MTLKLIDYLFEAPEIEDIDFGYCAKYARLAAKELTDAEYIPGDAWDLGKKNKVVKELTQKENLNDFKEFLYPGETIVIFYNPLSIHNKRNRTGTHAALYLGKDSESDELLFAQEYLGNQLTAKYGEMMDLMILSPRQILDVKG
jgi:hypothetical protein